MGGGGKVKSDFHDEGGGGVRQKVIFDDQEGKGEGVSKKVIFDDEGGGGVRTAPKKMTSFMNNPLRYNKETLVEYDLFWIGIRISRLER